MAITLNQLSRHHHQMNQTQHNHRHYLPMKIETNSHMVPTLTRRRLVIITIIAVNLMIRNRSTLIGQRQWLTIKSELILKFKP